MWTVSLDGETHGTLLSAEERERAAKFHFERDRVRWIGARSALRSILSQYVKMAPVDLRFTYGVHGKPALEQAAIHFNISHSNALAMIAVTYTAPVGIDIERIRADVDIAKLLLRIGESAAGTTAELFQTWARREAKTKAVGGPLMEIPLGDLRVIDLKAPAGHAAALALAGKDPRVLYRTFH